jgi:hypothetical protein
MTVKLRGALKAFNIPLHNVRTQNIPAYWGTRPNHRNRTVSMLNIKGRETVIKRKKDILLVV